MKGIALQLVVTAALATGALCACSVDATDHPRYGLMCAGDASYLGFCLTLDGGGQDAGGGSSTPGMDGSTMGGSSGSSSVRDAMSPMMPAPQAGNGASAGAGGGSSAGSEAPMCDPASAECNGGAAGSAGSEPPPECMATAATEPTACNGVDEDCDGHIDEQVKLACYEATQGCTPDAIGYRCTGTCRAGVARCAQGAQGACEGQVVPEAESCAEAGELASDEDCDGRIDEGCACTGPAQPCYSGAAGTRDVGPCRAGTRACSAGDGACEGQVLPEPESCANAGADDDCDGEADDVPGLGEPCTAAAPGRCAAGRSRCEGARLQCAPGASREEQCDGADDDCDGKVDESFDLPNNEQNCGRCGRRCNAGQTCCDGNCVNVSDSADHCGACGNACGSGLSCCSGTCFNLASDQNNCGSCGNACGLLEGCCGTGCRLLSLGC